MKLGGVGVHLMLLLGGVAAAAYVWTRDEKATVAAVVGDVVVWPGRSQDVRRVSFEGKGKKVLLESKSDASGRWFQGTAVTSPVAGDAAAPAPGKATTFVSVGAGEKVATGLAPLRASRDLGKIEGARAAEFGLDDPEGTLVVTVGDVEHRVAIGAPAPGGADRYVREVATGVVYATKGDFLRDLVTGEPALAEHDLHGFKDGEIERIRVIAHGKTREVLRRGPEGKRIWADPRDPEKADETVTNWLAKVDRLRPGEYPEQPSSPPEVVVRIEYTANGASGAFVELAKEAPTASDAKPEYRVRTERTRLWAKVAAPLAEQVEQDATSVVP